MTAVLLEGYVMFGGVRSVPALDQGEKRLAE